MKVFLTGGTGFLGSFVLQSVRELGHTVRALARKTSSRARLQFANVEIVDGDILDPGSLDRGMEGCDAVIHTAAMVSFKSGDAKVVRELNIRGAENVFAAAERAKVRRFVHASSVATMGATTSWQIIDETAPWGQKATQSPYHLSKWDAEQKAIEYVRRGLPMVILNPGLILGPDDVNLTSTRLVLHFLNGTLPGYVAGGFSAVDVRDAGRAFAAALEQGRVGERYILAGSNTTLTDFFALLADITGLKAPPKLPTWLAYGIACAADALVFAVPPLGHTKVGEANRPTVRAARQYTLYDCKKAQSELGYGIMPLEQSLRDTVASLVSRGLVTRKLSKTVERSANADAR